MKLLNEFNIKQIFKGDQNVFWDALITDSSIVYQLSLEKSKIKFTPFIHDEKFGAPDQNLIHCLDKPSNSFFISEDYCDSAGDATYLNFDMSYGIFYLPVVEETRLNEYYVSPKSIARSWVKLKNYIDQNFILRCTQFGLFLGFQSYSDQGFGEIPNQKELNCFFDIHPEQRISYLFSRAIGRFGIAPVKDKNMLISSVSVNETNMVDSIKKIMNDYLMKGLLEQSNSEMHNQIIARFELIKNLLSKAECENYSIADFEDDVLQNILNLMKKEFHFKLTKSSTILLKPKDFGIDHFYFHSFIEKNDLMSEIYNISLNQTKMSIQRIIKGEKIINLPFYVNKINLDNRFTRSELFLNFEENRLFYKSNNDFITFEQTENSFISGKAIPFLNEFRLKNRIIALPEHGSKYTPACDAFIVMARKKSIPIPDANILRISIHFLDQLKIAKDRVLHLPKILVAYFGPEITCNHFSEIWRIKVLEIHQLLEKIKNFVSDGKECKMAKTIVLELLMVEKNESFAKFMDNDMLNLLIDLTEQYNSILVERKKQKVNSSLKLQYNLVSFKIKLLVRYYMQQLLQVHDGLLYLNDRPYSLAIHLMFGAEFVEELIKNVTFRVESV